MRTISDAHRVSVHGTLRSNKGSRLKMAPYDDNKDGRIAEYMSARTWVAPSACTCGIYPLRMISTNALGKGLK